MYGQGHEFNNYFNSPGNSYCIGVGSYGSVLIENNYFEEVRNPHQFMYDVYSYAAASGNIYDNTTGTRDTGLGGSRDETGHDHMEAGPFDPPYQYTLDAAETVPETVKNCAGPQ
jgi:pectate lyase